MQIYNPGRFEWLNTHTLVDTANNEENIKILQKMIKKMNIKKEIIILFGTTQTDTKYAQKLSQMIQGNTTFYIDDFCDRSLPCREYISKNNTHQIIHLFDEKEKVQHILDDTSKVKII